MDWSQFIGRFHPLVVHLPIGFLLFGLILELISFIRKKESPEIRKVTAWSYLAGALGALMSAIVGLLLAKGGGYDAQALAWHKWMGIGLVVLTLAIYLVKTKMWDKKRPVLAYSLIILSFIVVSFTGHLGGNLTHGSDYLLVHAPPVVKYLAGMEAKDKQVAIPENVDSVMVFQHIIQPVLEEKCASCHNPSKAKGGLDLSSLEKIQIGGESGNLLGGTNPLQGELVHRVTLPSTSEKFMPPQGKALSYGEVELIKWWISQGATDSVQFSSGKLSDELLTILDRDYGLDASPKPFIEKLKPASVSEEILTGIREQGINISRLSPESSLLEISLQQDTFTPELAASLEPVLSNIVYADLGNTKIAAESFEVMGKMKNLIRLDIRNSNVGDEEIKQMGTLQHLEVINAHGTSVSKEALTAFTARTSPLKIYLWNTKVSEAEIKELSNQHPHLNLIGGASS
ncbi:ribonuclease inhibitor [Echinicola sediminis]